MIGKILLQQGRSKLTGNCCRLNIRAKRTKRVEKLAMWTIAGLFCRNTLVGSDEMQIAKNHDVKKLSLKFKIRIYLRRHRS